MFKLIKNGRIESDEWKTLTLAQGETPHSVRLPVGPVLVPLPVWRARRAELIHREYEHGWPLGIWLAADEDPEAIKRDIDDFTVIAIELNRSADGNGYTTARQLRERYGYKDELRATGDVPHDKLSHLHQAGFNAFAVRTNNDSDAELSDLHDSSAAYQAAISSSRQQIAAVA